MNSRNIIIGLSLLVSAGCLDPDQPVFVESDRALRGRSTNRSSGNETLMDGIPRKGLLAFYTFDETLQDLSGGEHHAEVHGAVLTTDRFGRARSALLFDGIDDYVDLTSSNTLQVQLPVSISYWVLLKQTEITSAAITTNFSLSHAGGVFGTFDSNGANPAFSFADGGIPGKQSRHTKHADSGLGAERWYHVVGVVRGLGDISVYVDGVESGGSYDGSAHTLAYVEGPVSLGRRVASNGAEPIFFRGALDEVAIYGSALTASAVQQLFFAAESAYSSE